MCSPGMGDASSLLEQAALQSELEDLLGCPVHVMTTGGLTLAREDGREQIEREAGFTVSKRRT